MATVYRNDFGLIDFIYDDEKDEDYKKEVIYDLYINENAEGFYGEEG